MRVTVDQSHCQGHALCEGMAPDVFETDDDDGRARVLVDVIPPDRESAVELAASSCPERAITILA
ncbi:MAG: ferredoxin [Marmoricola sp.]|nr:ferredoxin [Marmoricola sp.]